MPTFIQKPAAALTLRGNASNWPPFNKPPTFSIGFPSAEGSWPILPGYDKSIATSWRTIWRSPQQDTGGGAIWDQPARFIGIKEWIPQQATGWFLFDFLRQLKQFTLDQEANARPLVIPWSTKWVTPGGTDAHKDNGVIIDMGAGQSYTIQGMRDVNLTDIWLINLRAGKPVAKLGDFVTDGVGFYKPGDPLKNGSQGPKAKFDGLITPRYLRELIPVMEARLVGFNVEFGPTAKAISPGWVEHPLSAQPYAYAGSQVVLPSGPDDWMIPCFTGFTLDITDANIEAWLDSLDKDGFGISSVYRESRRWFARNLRGWTTDADAPSDLTTRKTRLRLSESGTGDAIIESVGLLEPVTRAEFAALGVLGNAESFGIGRNLLRFGKWVVTDGRV